MKILEYTTINRQILRDFEKNFYSLFSHDAIKKSNRNIGKNFSFAVIEKENKRIIVLFDVDDGTGITPCKNGKLDGDCKLSHDKFDELKKDYNTQNFIIFKAQLDLSRNKYYPFKKNVYPLGYFCNNYEFIKKLKFNSSIEKDIDVAWVGTVNLNASPWNWPKDQDIKMWPTGWRINGYKRLINIKERRSDLKIVVSNQKLPVEKYLNLIARSKICLELPGCGWLTRRFVENICLGKCILSMKQSQILPFDIKENYHYHTLGHDLDSLESELDVLRNNTSLINYYENNTKDLKDMYDPKNIAKYVYNKILKEFHGKN